MNRRFSTQELKLYAEKAAWMIENAKRPGLPEDALCGHFGVHESAGKGSIDMHTVGFRSRIHMVFKAEGHIFKSSWDALRERVTEATGIQVWECWNGEDGHDSMGVTLMEFASDSFRQALVNYSELGSKTFNQDDQVKARYDAFDKWWEDGKSG